MLNALLKSRILPFALLVCTSGSIGAVNVGEMAPNIKLPQLESESSLSLADFRGKVVYLDFWASWCGSCRVSLPMFSELRDEFSKKGFEVIGVNVDKKTQLGIDFINKYPVSFPMLKDPAGKTPQLYSLKGMPSSFLIDKTGKVRHVHVGFKKSDMPGIRQQVISLLKEK